MKSKTCWLAWIKLLLASNADPAIKDENGETALDHAKRAQAADIVKILEEAPGKTNPGR